MYIFGVCQCVFSPSKYSCNSLQFEFSGKANYFSGYMNRACMVFSVRGGGFM